MATPGLKGRQNIAPHSPLQHTALIHKLLKITIQKKLVYSAERSRDCALANPCITALRLSIASSRVETSGASSTFTMADLFLAVQISSYQLVLKEDLMKEVAPGIHKIVEEVKQNELKEYFEKYFIQ